MNSNERDELCIIPLVLTKNSNPKQDQDMILLRNNTESELIAQMLRIMNNRKYLEANIIRKMPRLKDRRVKSGALLGWKEIVVDGVRVFVSVYKYSYYQGGVYKAEAVTCDWLEVTDPEDGSKGWLQPCMTPDGFVVESAMLFSPHFCQRVKERSGKSFLDHIKDGSYNGQLFFGANGAFNGNPLYAPFGEDGQAIVNETACGLIKNTKGIIRVLATYVSTSMLKDNQILPVLAQGIDSRERLRTYNDTKFLYF